MIEVNLICSDSYELTPSTNISDGTDNTSVNIEAFKVIFSMAMHAICAICFVVCLMASNVLACMKLLPPIVILTILIFNMIFNIAGAIPLYLHNAPYCGGIPHPIRGSAVMSSLALAYNVIITILYCASPSIRRRSRREKNVPKDEKGELNKDGDKEGNKDFKRKKGKSKELGDNVEKPAESSELQDGHEQVKPSEANVKKPNQSVDLQENREQLKPSEAKMKKLASASDVKESREQSKRSSKSPGQRKNAGEQEGAETDEIPAKGSKDKQDLRSPKQRKNADEQEGAETDEKPAKASKDKEGKVAKSAKVEADDVNLRTARGRVSSPQD